jgi:hypothetical protein
MTVALKRTAIAISTVACATLLPFNWSEQSGISLGVESAQARVGRPLTPVSVAGVARRQHRRAAYGYGAAAVGAGAVGAAALASSRYSNPYYYSGSPYYYGGYGTGYNYGTGYYGGYVNRSYITGRRTLVPRSYGGSYGAYAADGYPASYYGGGYVNRSYITGRPTLFPRYNSGWGW